VADLSSTWKRLLVTASAEIELRSFVSASDIEIGSSGTVRCPPQLAQIVDGEGAFSEVAGTQAKIAFGADKSALALVLRRRSILSPFDRGIHHSDDRPFIIALPLASLASGRGKITDWLEVRVLPTPPRSRYQTEISRFFMKSPELAGIRATSTPLTVTLTAARGPWPACLASVRSDTAETDKPASQRRQNRALWHSENLGRGTRPHPSGEAIGTDAFRGKENRRNFDAACGERG